MTEAELAEKVAADPAGAWRALNLADAKEHFADFCGMIEIPRAPLKDDDGLDGEDEEPDDIVLEPIERESAAHITLLQNTLQDVCDGKRKRVMIFMPPGSAKSTYASVCFPAFVMGVHPRHNIILATYASPLARKMGRRARSIVKQPVYGEIFGLGLATDTNAADEWALTNGNEFMAGGILSGMTGNRAHGLLVDDPVKGRDQAESKLIRDKVWDEYQDSLLTRLSPDGWVVIIQTRWHEDDLSGRILPDDYDGRSGEVLGKDGEVWFVICIPAEADREDDPLGRPKGGLFWPEWFPADHWNKFRVNARTWASLFQQKPRPLEGSYFAKAAFKRFTDDALPRSLRYYATSDYAVTQDGGDFTSLRVWGVDSANPPNIYLVDGWRGQSSSDIWIEKQIDLMLDYRRPGRPGISRWFGEAGVIQKSIEPALRARMRTRNVACSLEWLPSINDKATRARAAQSLVQSGRIFVRDDADGDAFIEECASFPDGRWDDDVDNLSLIGRALSHVVAARGRDRPETAEGTGEVGGW